MNPGSKVLNCSDLKLGCELLPKLFLLPSQTTIYSPLLQQIWEVAGLDGSITKWDGGFLETLCLAVSNSSPGSATLPKTVGAMTFDPDWLEDAFENIKNRCLRWGLADFKFEYSYIVLLHATRNLHLEVVEQTPC